MRPSLFCNVDDPNLMMVRNASPEAVSIKYSGRNYIFPPEREGREAWYLCFGRLLQGALASLQAQGRTSEDLGRLKFASVKEVLGPCPSGAPSRPFFSAPPPAPICASDPLAKARDIPLFAPMPAEDDRFGLRCMSEADLVAKFTRDEMRDLWRQVSTEKNPSVSREGMASALKALYPSLPSP